MGSWGLKTHTFESQLSKPVYDTFHRRKWGFGVDVELPCDVRTHTCAAVARSMHAHVESAGLGLFISNLKPPKVKNPQNPHFRKWRFGPVYYAPDSKPSNLIFSVCLLSHGYISLPGSTGTSDLVFVRFISIEKVVLKPIIPSDGHC